VKAKKWFLMPLHPNPPKEQSCEAVDLTISLCVWLVLQCVMREYPDARMAYGESDEYSFVLHKDTCLYGELGKGFMPRF